ncbi:hypothetical protein F4827_001215 [Paraburkholderia bannensis]|uniref:Uncharacterized protein n=1 Tax=Paraburkholderia bannensis TaxID=765414 RepID=A0A7W9WRK8_9BURK|nr:hypothetical protein [Paraburkholderia sp. WP4_3_2]MBB6101381.1 hypothetical protein [Paraburkholderia bannensis]
MKRDGMMEAVREGNAGVSAPEQHTRRQCMNLQAVRKLPEIPEAGATHYATRRFFTDAASVLYERARCVRATVGKPGARACRLKTKT